MGYLAGSHRLGLRKFINIFHGTLEFDPDDPVTAMMPPEIHAAPENILEHPAVAALEPTYVTVPRGGVAFHHGLTVHLAKPNRSTSTRRVHTMIYFRDGSTRDAQGVHPCVDRPGIAVGAVIDSEVTPIAWPRPDDSLPDTPPQPMLLGPKEFQATLRS